MNPYTFLIGFIVGTFVTIFISTLHHPEIHSVASYPQLAKAASGSIMV